MQLAIDKIISDEENYKKMKESAWDLLQKEYKVERSYKLIKDKINV